MGRQEKKVVSSPAWAHRSRWAPAAWPEPHGAQTETPRGDTSSHHCPGDRKVRMCHTQLSTWLGGGSACLRQALSGLLQ